MRILMLNYEYPPLGGGTATANQNLLKEFAGREGISIDLITSSADKYKEEEFADNINIYYLDIGKRGDVQYQLNKELLKYSLAAWKFAKKLKKKNSYDLVHAFQGIPSGFVAMFLGLPYAVSLRGSDVPFYNKRFYWLDKLFFQFLSKVIWKRARQVTANSQDLKNLALKTSKKQEISVIYNGVYTNKFKPDEEEHENFTVLSTSRLIERKGLRYLVQGFIDFAKDKSDARLILDGGGDLIPEMKELAKKSGAGEKIQINGTIPREEIIVHCRQSDVFVLPSFNEGMSNSMLEAMASGLAIISTDTGGARELIDDSNGFIIQKGNSDDIKKALEKLYNDRELLSSMKKASRKKTEKMTWEKMVNQYVELYKKACAE